MGLAIQHATSTEAHLESVKRRLLRDNGKIQKKVGARILRREYYDSSGALVYLPEYKLRSAQGCLLL